MCVRGGESNLEEEGTDIPSNLEKRGNWVDIHGVNLDGLFVCLLKLTYTTCKYEINNQRKL